MTIAICGDNDKVKETETLHAYRTSLSTAALDFDGSGKSPRELLNMAGSLHREVFKLYNEYNDELLHLRDGHSFDVVLTEGLPVMILVAKTIEVPVMSLLAYLPDPISGVVAKLPSQSSYNLPTMVGNSRDADSLPLTSFKFRLG